MNEFEAAQHFIAYYNAFKDDPEFVCSGTNIEKKQYKNLDFEIIKRILAKQNLELKIEIIDNIKCATVYPKI
ncbi:MAG: hypothetical protein J6K39_02825 [Clostridia bacterium]|nr:hypothetical protein [Clostridia bacterium]